ncbi:MAG: hypothetical protein M1818_007187 [Claussenomyces sp. TS43310]|nr:MAG: hypothetical protein M1818_007187 [Claussenomyces sp. TS43310]
MKIPSLTNLSRRINIFADRTVRKAPDLFSASKSDTKDFKDAKIPIDGVIMASSSRGPSPPEVQGASSLSQVSDDPGALLDDDSDDNDPVVNYSLDHALLSDDPLHDDTGDIVSFKRRPKQVGPSAFATFLSPLTGTRDHSSSPRSGTPRPAPIRSSAFGAATARNDDEIDLSANLNQTKDGSPLDWYLEGPGRRVGYEDLTAIDWIFEYTKERQRLRYLYSSASGLLGYLQQMLDASQVWVVLILTGLASGLVAAAIDIASDWLGDLKTGYCSAGDDRGRFYLNKYFCCWGYSELSQCHDWVPWSTALHIYSTGGKWFIEYFFFVVYSVCLEFVVMASRFTHVFHRLYLQYVQAFWSQYMLSTQGTVAYLRSRLSWEALLYGVF